jgi:hypothetical protein
MGELWALWAAGFRQDVGEVFAKSGESHFPPLVGENMYIVKIDGIPAGGCSLQITNPKTIVNNAFLPIQ